jgi:hypothetical protein
MKLSELQKVARRAEHARQILSVLDKAHGVEIDLLKANGRFVHYGDKTKVTEDAAFVEVVKVHLRDSQTKILNEALAQLAAHSIELDDPDVEDPDVEDDEANDDLEEAA